MTLRSSRAGLRAILPPATTPSAPGHDMPFFEISGSLVGASRLLTNVGLNAASIIAFVANGKLHAYRRPSSPFSCKDLLFSQRDIHAFITTMLAERGWLPRKDVTKLLKVKDGTLAKWVRAGLLTPAAVIVTAQYFDKDVVEKFVTAHVTSEEAARLLGIGVLTVQKWARQGRLQAVSGPGIDEHHDYLFNKEALLQWRDGRLSFGEAVNILGVSTATVHRWAHEGKITPLDDMGGKQRWFAREAVLELRREIEQKFAVPFDIADPLASSREPFLSRDKSLQGFHESPVNPR